MRLERLKRQDLTPLLINELDDGEIVDIMPPPPINPSAGVYPFLRAELPEQDFQAVSDALTHGAARLDHVYR